MSRSLWEWCGLQGFRLAVGIFGSSRSFIGSSSFFVVFGTDVVFLTVRQLSVRNQQCQFDIRRSGSDGAPSTRFAG
jgi:hypothetical protein